jgi:hypothetical protein
LSVLKWARENGCEWNDWTCTEAAYLGHLEVLKWAISNGCQISSTTLKYAKENGNLKILKWLEDTFYEYDDDK